MKLTAALESFVTVMRTTALAIMFTAGCAILNGPAPQTFNERAAVALSAVTSIRQSTLTLLQAKRITADDAENVQKQADNARSAIDIARKLNTAGDPGALDRLGQAQAVLTSLDAYLKTKGKSP